jgi:hypothetical protein
MFNFTFSFSVPGLSNPFARAPSPTPPPPPPAPAVRPRTPVLTQARAGSRKRGWEPAFAEPTTGTTATLAPPEAEEAETRAIGE